MRLDEEADALVTLYLQYIGLYIAVGVEHLHDPNKLFFYYGTLVAVTSSSLHLKRKDGGLVNIKIEAVKKISVGVQ